MFAALNRDVGFRAVDARLMFYCLAFLAGTLSSTDLHAQPTIDVLSRSGSRRGNGLHGPTVIAQQCSLRIRGLEPDDSLQILIDGAVARQAQCDGHVMMMPLKGLSLGWHTAEVKVTRRRNREVTQTRKTVERFPDRETTTTVEERLGNAEVLFAPPLSFEVVSQFGRSAGVRAVGFARLCSAAGEAETVAQDANDFRPFTMLPAVRRVLDPQDAATAVASPPTILTVQGNPPAEGPDTSNQAGWLTFCFDDPARFRLPDFSSCGSQLQTVGAVIYEGMRFRVGPQGRYRVSFEIGAPAMPLTLRMQLGLVSEAFGVQTLTLPPISIPRDKRSSAQAGVYLVQQDGWHPRLASDIDELRSVTRGRTTCRFGFGLDVP